MYDENEPDERYLQPASSDRQQSATSPFGDEPVRVVYTYVTDFGGMELVRYSALSVAMSQKSPCAIHIFCYRFTLAEGDAMHTALAELGATLCLEGIEDEELEQHPTWGHVTKPALLRLLAIERLTSRYDRIAYFDNDTLVFADLEINALSFGSSPVAAVIDMDLTETGSIARSKALATRGTLCKWPGYFNSGVLIFESNNFQAGGFYYRYVVALREHEKSCRFKSRCTCNDQCALNLIFEGQWLPLSTSYNMQATAKFTRYWKKAIVRHYCGRRKFVPVARFRNDGLDVAYLNEIRPRLGLPVIGNPWFYEVLFRLNVVRQYWSGRPLRRFLRSLVANAPAF